MRFCERNNYLALPANPAIITPFIEDSYGTTASRAVATVERYLSTISRARTLLR